MVAACKAAAEKFEQDLWICDMDSDFNVTKVQECTKNDTFSNLKKLSKDAKDNCVEAVSNCKSSVVGITAELKNCNLLGCIQLIDVNIVQTGSNRDHLNPSPSSSTTTSTSLIILGGGGAETDVEVFPANSNCTIPPPLPQPGRLGHSLSVINGTLVACGGYRRVSWKSCISWKKGQESWEDFHTLNEERCYHAAVVVDGEDQIILLGGVGSSSQTTGEIVKSGKTFSILNNGAGTCAVSYQGGFVMMGGDGANIGGGHGKVDRYDSEGNYLNPLPNLLEARYYHACTTFTSLKGLLVAGGKRGQFLLSSTELYLRSRRRWIRGGHLPRQICGMRAAGLIVTGGYDFGIAGDKVSVDLIS